MIDQRIHDDMPALRTMASRSIFRALMDYVHFKKWSNGCIPKNRNQRESKEAFETAREWLFDPIPENDDVRLREIDQTMSFESYCGILGWDPGWIRERIPKLKAADLRRVGKKNGFL